MNMTSFVPYHDCIEYVGNWDASRPIVCFLPALGVHTSYYHNFLETLSNQGFRVAALQLRTGGQNSTQTAKTDNFGYADVLTKELPAMVEAVRQRSKTAPLYLVGHSLGGQFGLLYAATHPAGISGVILIASGSNYFGSMPIAMRLQRFFGIAAIRCVTRVLGYYPGQRFRFGGNQPARVMLDWSYEGLRGSYHIIGSNINYGSQLSNLALPVFFLSLAGDRYVPKDCAHFLANKLQNGSVSLTELDATDYGLTKFDHFRWAKDPKPIVENIINWLKDNSI